jgi:signal transduction histidine kinase
MMYEITRLNLENEMDLVLAHKRSIRLGETLHLSVSNQTTFTTAISECCRVVLEKADGGVLFVYIVEENDRYMLQATIRCNYPGLEAPGAGALDYAKKLVSYLEIYLEDALINIDLKIIIPRTARLSSERILAIQTDFKQGQPDTPYEKVKRKKDELNLIASEQQEQLIRSRYVNEKKTEFLSIASHELKTPLTTIKAFAQLALSEEDPDAVRMYLSKINSQSDKLYKLIQQLLDVSKIEVGKMDFVMEDVPVNAYIQETVALIGKSIPSHRIAVELAGDVIASIDRLRMEQVFSNILINAAKYSKENTLIRVTTQVTPENSLCISFQDEGIGMSAQHLKRVFEKFFRVDEISRAHSGLGMGLYIASRIVTGHNGKIWIDSELDVGSTFHISIPFLRVAGKSDGVNETGTKSRQ